MRVPSSKQIRHYGDDWNWDFHLEGLYCCEHAEMRPKPISPQKREEVIVHMAARSWQRIAIPGHIGRSDPVPDE